MPYRKPRGRYQKKSKPTHKDPYVRARIDLEAPYYNMKTCQKKLTWAKKSHAKRFIKREGMSNIRIYRCNVCNLYHLSTKRRHHESQSGDHLPSVHSGHNGDGA